MTRRIGLAILITVWATLVVGGFVAYFTTRTLILSELDTSIATRAMSLPQIVDESGRRYAPASAVRPGDRYIVRNDSGRTVARPTTAAAATKPPDILRAEFSRLADGQRIRTVTLRAMAVAETGGEPQPSIIVYSASADRIDALLTKLMWACFICGGVGGVIAAGIARFVAREALRPLHETAAAVGEINERSLDRRIDQENLPPELAPVVGKLNEMLERLEESARARQQFVADASHELRTPVAAVMAALEVSLRHPREPQAYREAMQAALVDARLLQRLIEALLAQVKSGAVPLQYPDEQTDIAALAEECIAAVQPLADAASITLAGSGPRPLHVETQPERLRSVLINLVGNAIEHNHAGVEVTISWQLSGQNLIIRVADNGIGVAREHVSRLFEPFYRVDASRAQGHLGLGLYLVHQHVRSLGGEIEVASEVGKGTEFTIKAPIKEAGQSRLRPREELSAAGR